ncbi:hypothetical protein [Amycolatopsis sp. cmx-4-61]|uniref:hypothetical protein n=1 Tax=Amycolatopsis sp. cmx-4-61 TaxID=2790937 RepID=UPI00397C9799
MPENMQSQEKSPHLDTISGRLAYLDAIADRLAAELTEVGFVDHPRTDAAELRELRHTATNTNIVYSLSAVRLIYFERPDAEVGPRTVYRELRLGYNPYDRPVEDSDIDGIVLIARLVAAELSLLDAQLPGQTVA